MAETVEIIINGKNLASPALKEAASQLDKLGQQAQKIGTPIRNVGLALTAGVTTPLVALITKSTLAAAEVDKLDIVVKQLGATAGYSEDEIMGHVESVRGMGIEAAASREIIAKFVTAQLDAADAAKIARVAQDQAVISGMNSTETTMRLTDALVSGQTEMFRSMNMTLDLTGAYEDMAKSLGKKTDELTETEKVQARLNAIMEYGATVAGTYEAAMGDSGKAMESFKRYADDIFVAVGQHFTPALNEAVFAVGDLLKAIPDMISEGGALAPVLESWGDAASGAAGVLSDLTEKLQEMDPATVSFIGNMVGITAVMGPLLVVGGQTVIWLGKLAGALGAAAGPAGVLAVALYGVTAAMVHQAGARKDIIGDHEDIAQSALDASSSYEEYLQAIGATTEQIDNLAGVTGGYGIHLANTLYGVVVLTEAEWEAAKATGNLTDYNHDLADALGITSNALGATGQEIGNIDVALDAAAIEAQKFAEQMGKILSLEGNISGIARLAEQYDEMLGSISENTTMIEQYQAVLEKPLSGGYFDGVYYSLEEVRESLDNLGEQTEENEDLMKRFQQISNMGYGGYIDGVWVSTQNAKKGIEELTEANAGLEASMKSMADQVVLDMFEATIAVGTVTKAEFEAYMALGVELGKWSQDAADAAILVYGGAIDQINGMEIEDKESTNTVNFNKVDPWGLYRYKAPNTSSTHTIHFQGSGYEYYKDYLAAGGIVQGAAAGLPIHAAGGYWVGEAGPEPFFPEQNGRILSNSQATQAMREGGGGKPMNVYVTINTPINFADRVWVEQELAPYIRDGVQKAMIRG